MPQALALSWEILKDTSLSNADKKATLLDFDRVLGLGLDKIKEDSLAGEIPEEVLNIAEERETARQNKDWTKSDELRNQIEKLGYQIKDTDSGPKIIHS